MISRSLIRRPGLTLTLLACCVLIGCEPPEPDEEPPRCTDPNVAQTPDPGLPLAFTTDHLDIYVASTTFMCAGTAAELEQHAVAVADALDVEFDRRIPVYFGSIAECSEVDYAVGCTQRDGAVFALPRAGVLEHELAHSVACELRRGAAPFLSEGWARSVEPSVRSTRGPDPSMLITISAPEDLHYGHAAHFARWLFERDPEAFRVLYEMSPAGLDQDSQEALFEAAYQFAFQSLEAEYLQESPYQFIPFRQCDDLEDVVWQGDEFTIAVDIDCDDQRTRGPYSPSPILYDSMYRSFAIDIAQAGKYDATLEGARSALIQRCATMHPSDVEQAGTEFAMYPVFNTDGIVSNGLTLEPGRWRLDILAHPGPKQPVVFHMYPGDP